MNNFRTGSRLKKIAKIQKFIELVNLNYSTSGNNYSFNENWLPAVFLKTLND